MTDPTQRAKASGQLFARVCFAVAGLLLCLVFPAVAGAKPYEGVGTFGGVLQVGEEVKEEVQLGGVGALAVNYTGQGGVAKGTLYAVTQSGSPPNIFRVARYEPEGSGLKFVEAWRVLNEADEETRIGEGRPPYEICGPAVASESLTGNSNCPTNKENNEGAVGIAVNQATGNVYVVNNPSGEDRAAGEPMIKEYSANGAKLIARFGEPVEIGIGKTTAETPGKLHEVLYASSLAVNSSGEVFVFDLNSFDDFYHRLMVFKPKTPGDYTAYEYAGQSRDIGAGFFGETSYPTMPVVDQAGDIYVAEREGSAVQKYDPATPDSPICSFEFPPAGIIGFAVNQVTGEPFFYSYLKRPRRIHQLSACEGGSFHETGETEVAPERAEVNALAFDPTRQLSAGREPGVLYAAAPGPVPVTGKGQPGTSALGYIFAQPEERPPSVSALTVGQVTTSSANLIARIDPRGFSTQYAFRYLTQATYQAENETFTGADEAPVGGASVAAADGARQVEAAVSGLEPDTAYVFRVVASSNCAPAEPTKVCTTESNVASFHTYPFEAAGLPDGRAYELVSPPGKGGGQVFPAAPGILSCLPVLCKPGGSAVRFPLQSSLDGGSVVYEGDPFDTNSALIENEYLSRRGSTGWATTNLTPNLLTNGEGNGYVAFDPTLTVGVLSQSVPALTSSTPGEYRNLYSQSTADPATLTALLTSTVAPTCLPGSGAGGLQVSYTGASTDLSRLFFEANDALTPESTGGCGQSNLYEWANGALRVVNIPPAAANSTPGAMLGSGTMLESGNANNPLSVTTHAISEDGSRVFFTGSDDHLYVRIEGATTLEVPGPDNCSKVTPLAVRACFLTASADGSSVLLSDGQVYALDGAGTAYEPTVDLTQGKGGFLGIAGQSEDLDNVYFVDTANLTGAEENDQDAVAEEGKNNLYAWVEGTTHFVATLAAQDNSDTGGGDWVAAPGLRTAEASPGGRFLAFTSQAPLSGYDSVGLCKYEPEQEIGGKLVPAHYASGPCDQVFLYDSQEQELTCASCNPSGSRPAGPAVLRRDDGARGHLPQPHYLTEAGRLFFDTSDRLLPADTNGRVEDLYEYQPAGVGGCSQAGHCLHLISSGRGSSDSNFLAMDETGGNVFFTTRERLVRADKDELIDLYDARVGGGFLEIPQLAECKGEGCQQAPVTPSQSSPSSMGLPGELDPKAGGRRPCKKGQVKRKGRCVKKHKKHHKHRTRHHKGGK